MQKYYGGRKAYLVLDEGVDPLQHPLAGELIGQVGLNLLGWGVGGGGEAQSQCIRCISSRKGPK